MFNLTELAIVLLLSLYLVVGALLSATPIRLGGIGPALGIYAAALVLSSLVNWNTLNWQAAGTFFLTNLEGILLYVVFLNSTARKPNAQRALFRLIFYLGLLQPVWILVTGQLATVVHSVDLVTGTFGVNPSQLCFYAVAMLAFALGGRELLGRRRSNALVAIYSLVFILPGWRAAWPILPVVFVATKAWLTRSRGAGTLLPVALKTISLVLVVVLLLAGAATFGAGNYFLRQLGAFRALVDGILDGSVRISEFGKVRSYLDIPLVWMEEWHIALVGTGPGTYNSRAYHTFALIKIVGGDPATGVVHDLVNGSSVYRTEISNKYILPLVNKTQGISGTIGSTLGSYVSNVVETGLIGFLAWCSIYWTMLKRCRLVYQFAADPFYRMVAYAATALLVFTAFVSFYDDWFAVGRTMVLTWTLLAIVSCGWDNLVRGGCTGRREAP